MNLRRAGNGGQELYFLQRRCGGAGLLKEVILSFGERFGAAFNEGEQRRKTKRGKIQNGIVAGDNTRAGGITARNKSDKTHVCHLACFR